MNKLLTLISLGLIVFMASPANAVTITFEGEYNTIYSAPINRSGFLIGNPTGQEQHFHEITSTSFLLPNNGTGILLNDRDTEIFVEEESGSDFTLTSVDVATATGNLPADGIEIRGYLNNVLVNTITLASFPSGYSTLLGNILGTVDQLVFNGLGGGGGFVLDNLTLNGASGGQGTGIPEPASALLLSMGLGGALLRRKKRA